MTAKMKVFLKYAVLHADRHITSTALKNEMLPEARKQGWVRGPDWNPYLTEKGRKTMEAV